MVIHPRIMEAAPALARAIDALTTADDSRVKAFFRRLTAAVGRNEDPQAFFKEQNPEVVLLSWLLAAATAGGAAVRERNAKGQWNQQWTAATSWAATVAGWVSSYPAAAAAAAAPNATLPVVGVGAPAVAGAAAGGAAGAAIFALATYFDKVTDVSPALGQASYGAAYKALMITADVGYLIDNDIESEFLAHVADIVVRGDTSSQFSPAMMPMPTEGTHAEAWRTEWCEYINEEFACWIKAMYRVDVRPVEHMGAGDLNGLHADYTRKNHCGAGSFTDLAAWQEDLRAFRAGRYNRQWAAPRI